MSFLDDLKTTKPADTSKFSALPKGSYRCLLDNAVLALSEDPIKVSLTFKVLDGDYANRLLFKNYQMNEKGMPYFLADFKMLGYDPQLCDTEDQLGQMMADIVSASIECECGVTTREFEGKTYNNVYINDVLTADGGTKAPSVDTSDEIPF